MKNYDFELQYHLGKVDVAADTLNMKTIYVSYMMIRELELVENLRNMKLHMELGANFIRCSNLTMSNDFLSLINEKQLLDPRLYLLYARVKLITNDSAKQ